MKISPMVQSWINHLLISIAAVALFGFFGYLQLGAFGAFSFYLGREVRCVEIELAVGKVNWIDHVGDLAGPTLLLILVSLLV